jgi:hypothetical protein
MLAMVVNDYAGSLTARGVLASIASMLAPTDSGAGTHITPYIAHRYL